MKFPFEGSIKFVLAVLLYMIIGSLQLNAQDCSSIKYGRFKIVDEKHGTTLITRVDDIQIEENKKYGLLLKFKVDWKSDCLYTLKLIEVVQDESNFNYPKDLSVSVRVSEISNDSYKQESTTNISDFISTSSVTIIEKN